VRAGQICAQVGAMERRLQGYERIEVLGHLPEQEVAVTPDPHQAVGAEQQPTGEAFNYLAELDLRARLALGGQPPPGAVELVEGEAHDLTLLGGLRAHGTQSNAECLRAAPSRSSAPPTRRSSRLRVGAMRPRGQRSRLRLA